MAELYLGQIIQGGWNFAPRGTHICDGSMMGITQNTALFAVLSTSFGGNGSTTFGLPDLRGRVAIGTGASTSGSSYVIGQSAGTEQTTLTQSNMPMHTHTATFTGSGGTLAAGSAKATLQTPENNAVLCRSVDGSDGGTALPQIYCPAGTATDVTLAGVNAAGVVTVGAAGGNLPFPILQPYLAVTSVIVTAGIYPTRN